jgi:DNA ligase 1
MRLDDLVTTSDAVARVAGRLEKIDRLAALLARVPPEEVEMAIAFLTGSPRQGRIGIGGAAIRAARPGTAAETPSLELREVDRAFEQVRGAAGPGSIAEKSRLLRALLERATRGEQDFLVRLLFGELRQGALEGVLTDAVARAASVPGRSVRRAAMLAGDLGAVAHAALTEGEAGLDRFAVELFRPIQPMLAETAASVSEALGRLDAASLEYKLDGARIQAHKGGDDVQVFSRGLRDVTPAVPEVVEVVRALPARELVLDGEVIALRPDDTPHPFQVTMRRFGRRLEVERLRQELPLSPFFFDVLHVDGETLLDRPQAERFGTLGRLAPPGVVIPSLSGATAASAEAFLEEALARGHEGVMAKDRASEYAAGSRGQAWLKVKVARTLDLVVLAAEWGSGRRRGWLSNLHLGARDPARGGFVMLGKTFKGLTDETLSWQTARFLEIEIGRDDYAVYVRPELVVEIAFSDLQASPHYPGGLALRFARVKRYRADKTAAEADTIGTVREIYRRATGQQAPDRSG